MKSNLSYRLKPVRINLQYKFLIKFDHSDKFFLNSAYQRNSTKLLIQAKPNFIPSKISLLTSGITLEILNQQRVMIQNQFRNKIQQNFCFNLTLRKTKMLIFLEICLLSLLLAKLTSLNFNSSKLNQSFSILFSDKIMGNVISQTRNNEYSFQIIYFEQDKIF